MPTPSLLIVPARFKTGTLYSQIPVPVAPSTSSVGDFTVTRATSATRVNASGLIESAKTNLVLRSEEFDNASIFKQRSSVSGNTIAAPDGNLTADTYSDITSVAGSHFIRLSDVSAVSGTTYAVSVFAKAGASNRIELSFRANNEGAIGFGETVFDLASGVIVNGTGSIIALSNNWYRCTSVGTVNASGTSNVFCYLYNSANQKSYTGTSGTNNVFIWGAQVEEGSSASEYIPTTTVARTRFAGVTVDGTVASGIPRLDYFASGGVVGCPALLVEPSGQNLALQSENYGTTWSPNQLLAFGSGSVLNTTGTLDPYGTNVADLIVANTVSGVQHRIDQTTTSASGSYTFSVFVKAAGYNFTWLRIGTVGAFFNLSNGAITGTSAGIVASSQNFGNGWFRCIISKASSSANEVLRINIIQTDGVTDFAGDGTSGIYVFGAQYELNTVATSYIPTTFAAVTRNADVISVSGAVSGAIGQTEGTIYAEVTFAGGLTSRPTTRQIMNISDGTDNNRVAIYIADNTTIIFGFITANGSNLLNNGASFAGVASAKIAIAYKSADYAIYVNGVVAASGTTAFSFATTLNQVTIGSRHNFIGQLNDRIRAAALYTTRLTNAQLAALTT